MFWTALRRSLRGWLVAVITTGLLATLASAQFVIAALSDIGAVVPIARRLALTGKDIIGLLPLYLIFIAIGFLIAFSVSGVVLKFIKLPRTALYSVAGAASMGVMLWAMERVFFGVPIIAGARSSAGFVTQIICGAIGGYVFARLSRVKPVMKANDNFEILTV